MRWITLESRAGEAVTAGARRLIPLSRVIRVHLPGQPGGVVWNRPAAVLVREADGQEIELPVRDVTRLAQLAILTAGLLGSWLIWIAFRPRKE
jgi:hypothetical protein